MIRVDGVLSVTPSSEEEVLQVVRWAATEGLRVRPVGAFHTWSPVPAATFRAGTTLAQAVREGDDRQRGRQ